MNIFDILHIDGAWSMVIEEYEQASVVLKYSFLPQKCTGCGKLTDNVVSTEYKGFTIFFARCEDCMELDRTPVGHLVLNYYLYYTDFLF